MSQQDKLRRLIDEDEIKKFILERLSEKESEKKSLIIGQEYLNSLKSNYELLNTTINFEKGDLVKWKKGLKNRRIPEYNQPVIVIDILEKPYIAEDENTGSAGFREPLDLLLGILVDDTFSIFHYDKRRFEKY